MDNIQSIFGLIISLSTVLGIFSAIINKTFDKKLKPLEDKIDTEHNNSLKRSMETWRYSVVQFASDLHNGKEKTKYEYEAILVYIDNYTKAVEELDVVNSVFEEEELYIRSKYRSTYNK